MQHPFRRRRYTCDTLPADSRNSRKWTMWKRRNSVSETVDHEKKQMEEDRGSQSYEYLSFLDLSQSQKIRSLSTGDINDKESSPQADLLKQKQQLLDEVLCTKYALETKRKTRDTSMALTQTMAGVSNRYARAQTAIQEESERTALQLRQRKISTTIKLEGLEKICDRRHDLQDELDSLKSKLICLDSTLQQNCQQTKEALKQLDSQRLNELKSLHDSGLFEEALILQNETPTKSRSYSAEMTPPDIVLTNENGNYSRIRSNKQRSSSTSLFFKLRKSRSPMRSLYKPQQKSSLDSVMTFIKGDHHNQPDAGTCDSDIDTWYDSGAESGRSSPLSATRKSSDEMNSYDTQSVVTEPEYVRTQINPKALHEIADFENYAKQFFTDNGLEYLCQTFPSLTQSERKRSIAEVMFF